jgi:hypothetical protein
MWQKSMKNTAINNTVFFNYYTFKNTALITVFENHVVCITFKNTVI